MNLQPNDFAKYAPTKQPRRAKSLIERADAAVNIIEVYNSMGFSAPYGSYGSYKVDCPFYNEHSDGGLDKNCRIYPPTHIFCFGDHGVLKPSFLYSRWKAISVKRAAVILLEERGLLKPRNYREQWNELIEARERAREANVSLGEPSYVIDALQTALYGNLTYQKVEYAPGVREAWRIVLGALDVLWASPDTDLAKLERWYEKSLKKISSAAIDAAYSLPTDALSD